MPFNNEDNQACVQDSTQSELAQGELQDAGASAAQLAVKPDDQAATENPQSQERRFASTDRMGTESIGKLLVEFSIPATVSIIVSQLYNIIDTAVLGTFVGSVGVAVTTVALPVMMFLAGVSMIAGAGGNALAAIQLGEGKKDAVEMTLGNSTNLLFSLSFAVAIVAIFFIDPVLTLIGCQPEIWEETSIFVRILCIGCAFQSLGNGLNNFLRTAGKPNLSLGASVLGTVMCIAFNLLFVAVFRWGVAGSACATILGQAIGMIPVVIYFSVWKSAPFRLHVHCLWPHLRLMGKILALGLASFVMQMASTIVSVVFNHVVALWGSQDPIGVVDGLAAIGVAQKAGFFGVCFFIGVSIGAQPLIGYNFGARKWDRVMLAVKEATAAGFVMGVILCVLVHIFPNQIVNLFGVSGDLETFAASALTIYTILYPLVGAQIISASYFQSSGQPVKAALLELIRQVVFLIPLYLVAPPFLSQVFGQTALMGVVLCSPVSDTLAVLVTAGFVGYEWVKLRRLRAAEQEAAA